MATGVQVSNFPCMFALFQPTAHIILIRYNLKINVHVYAFVFNNNNNNNNTSNDGVYG